ncbi:15-hydroxyprostaglandin dehydrogenase [Diaporthe amygdali]|uniref:15-hydroxyprostaglandin dehydrogenase n=1 Tax=Phomopsis amygdali TaxID=1214568 RepID=UPI0022FE3251|nr:15-hydroxyprostaglandin dehydrogenase [Diaporthe amygdali]KAJ0120592.1 15-hydroxyprostaglandin dehydrogenase [Diaporthe amygdali]
MGSTAPAERKVVVITGSTSGIGKELAERLHPKGYNIVVSGRRSELGQAVANELDPTGETVIFVQCDVASHASQANLLKTTWDKWKRLDVFIANAGIVDQTSRYNLSRKDAPIEDVPPEPELKLTDIDFKGVVYGTELAVHYMRHNPPHARGGKIMITGSIAAIYPVPIIPEYSAVKAAALQWARVMAPMLAQEGITINNILPNGYDTDIMPGFQEAFLEEHLTDKECLMKAYDVFLDDVANEKTGQTIETAYKSHYYHDIPPHKSGNVIARSERVYEPWFELIHGARSGLPTAIKEPLRKPAE